MSRHRTTSFGAIALLAVMTGATSAADRHVPAEYATIQTAIDAAAPGDTVIVADGVYRGEGNRDLTFDGKAITVRSAGGPDHCTLDCQGTQENPHRGVSFTSGETRASVFEGFTICNGSTPQGAIADVFNGAAVLCADGSSPTIRHCVFRDNWAGCWGGAICCSTQSSPLIDGCVIANNHSDDDGGGVFAWNSSNPTIVNSFIVDNSSVVTGGGVTNFGGLITIRNTTIAGNACPFGGGVYGWNTTIVNSIVHGNTSGTQIEGGPTVSYSNIEDGHDGVGNVDIDPKFVNAPAGDYHLAPSSPMVDAGDPAFVPTQGETDVDGDPRLVGIHVDMGADEQLHLGDVNHDGVVDFADLLETLTAWGPCPGCAADTNGDGLVNFTDLLTLLANWGA